MSEGHLVIGAGGHASVLIEILLEQKTKILGYVSPNPAKNIQLFSNCHWYKSDSDILQFDKSKVKLVNGIGSLPKSTMRAEIYHKFKNLDYTFATVVSRNAHVSKYARLGEGVQVMCGVIIQTGANIGYNSIVNTGAIVDHDCSIGSDNHIAPGVSISGEVTSRSNVHFGTGSCVIQSVCLGENVVIAAGTSVYKNIESNTICFPAGITKKVIK